MRTRFCLFITIVVLSVGLSACPGNENNADIGAPNKINQKPSQSFTFDISSKSMEINKSENNENKDEIKLTHTIRLKEINLFGDEKNGRKISMMVYVCNLGTIPGNDLKLNFWYTPANGQNTIVLSPGKPFSLLPGACRDQERWAVVDNSFVLNNNGKLFASQSESNPSSLDLTSLTVTKVFPTPTPTPTPVPTATPTPSPTSTITTNSNIYQNSNR